VAVGLVGSSFPSLGSSTVAGLDVKPALAELNSMPLLACQVLLLDPTLIMNFFINETNP